LILSKLLIFRSELSLDKSLGARVGLAPIPSRKRYRG